MADIGKCCMPWDQVYLDGWREPDVVHQAAGMVMAQLRMGARDAIARLRAEAALHDEPVTTVAQAVIDRRLKFDR